MGVFEKLEQIREKPVAMRRRLLFIWMAISMTVVIILWIGILRLEGSDQKPQEKGPNPFEILKKGFEASKEVYIKGN